MKSVNLSCSYLCINLQGSGCSGAEGGIEHIISVEDPLPPNGHCGRGTHINGNAGHIQLIDVCLPGCSTKTPPIRTRLFYIYGRLFRCGNKQRLKASAFSFQIPNRFQIEKSRPALLSSGFLLFKYYFSLSEAASTLTGSPTRSSGSFK